MAFSDEMIRAIVKTGQYSDPAAEKLLADVLIQRRNKIGQVYLTKINPLVNLALDDFRDPHVRQRCRRCGRGEGSRVVFGCLVHPGQHYRHHSSGGRNEERNQPDAGARRFAFDGGELRGGGSPRNRYRVRLVVQASPRHVPPRNQRMEVGWIGADS